MLKIFIKFNKNFFYPKIIGKKIFSGFKFQQRILKEKLKFFLRILIFLIFILLLINPSFGISEADKKNISYEIVFGIDNSLSMLAHDEKEKNRFERGKQKISEIVDSLNGKFGLLEFSGDSSISIPFTSDKKSFSILLQKLEVNKKGNIGTNFNSISQNLDKFFKFKDENGNSEKILILISDGENLGQDLSDENLNFFKKNKVRILTIGIGSTEKDREGNLIGGKILLGKEEKNGGLEKIYKKYDGNFVFSKINEEFLKNISNGTSGKYFHEDKDLSESSEKILNFIKNNFEKEIILEKEIKEKKYFQFFAFLILILIILEIFLNFLFIKNKKPYLRN